MVGQSFPTKGHFYREIEILKFPYLVNNWRSKTGKNVYSAQQYDTIVDYFLDLGMIKMVRGKNCIQVHILEPKQKLNLNCFDCDKSLQVCTCMDDTINLKQNIFQKPITLTVGSNELNLHLVNGNYYELSLFDGQELSTKELKVINQIGLVYHSEILNVDYENKDSQIEYMNIYYFAKVENVQMLFKDCFPF